MIALMVNALLAWPGLLDDLDAEHVPDSDGRCAVCPARGEVCALRPALELAKRVRTERVRLAELVR